MTKLGRLPLYLILAMIISMGAMSGVSAESREDARIDIEEDVLSDNSYESVPEQEMFEGLFAFIFTWVNEVAVWSYENPAVAKTVLVNAPMILLGGMALRYGTLGLLTVYVAANEYRSRKEEMSKSLRGAWE